MLGDEDGDLGRTWEVGRCWKLGWRCWEVDPSQVARCRAASGSGWPSRARWRRSPRCCCWMRPRRPWTTNPNAWCRTPSCGGVPKGWGAMRKATMTWEFDMVRWPVSSYHGCAKCWQGDHSGVKSLVHRRCITGSTEGPREWTYFPVSLPLVLSQVQQEGTVWDRQDLDSKP